MLKSSVDEKFTDTLPVSTNSKCKPSVKIELVCFCVRTYMAVDVGLNLQSDEVKTCWTSSGLSVLLTDLDKNQEDTVISKHLEPNKHTFIHQNINLFADTSQWLTLEFSLNRLASPKHVAIILTTAHWSRCGS